MPNVELLAPAGNLEKLKTAIKYGADAVYMGGLQYGLRASAGNFTISEMQEGLAFAHSHQARVYVTVNILAHNDDLRGLPAYLIQLQELGVDAIIIADPGILRIAKQVIPNMEMHLSTQASNTNWSSAQFWAEQGIDRIILARELSAPEIHEIAQRAPISLEVFVHGAMCVSYSGRCLLSNYFTGRDANRGQCVQACRWRYALMEESRPGIYLPIEEDDRGSFIMNSKDMCLIEHIPQLMELGVSSFKIEGRMKSVHYVAAVTRIYRQAIDRYLADPDNYRMDPKWLEELSKPSHRPYFSGFFIDKPQEATNSQNISDSGYERPYDFIGVVQDYDENSKSAVLQQRNHFQVGEEVEIINPHLPDIKFTIQAIYDAETGVAQVKAPHAKQQVLIPVPSQVEAFGILRRARA